ncbi:MAG: glycosyltransferase family 4 protein [Fimbriimonas sp.]
MKIVVTGTFFSEGMGYTENCLPRALADLGHEVHVVCPNLHWYGNSPSYKETYERFHGPAIQPVGTRQVHNFTLHLLPHKLVKGYVQTIGLVDKLAEIDADIIQATDVTSINAFQIAMGAKRLRGKIFTECHQHMSVVQPYLKDPNGSKLKKLAFYLTRTLPTQLMVKKMKLCYAIAPDCGEVATKLYGVPEKMVKVLPLGTDTALFHPIRTEEDAAEREALRAEIGVKPDEILCIYTGRFAKDKNPLILAQAVQILRKQGLPFKSLFIGEGVQLEEILACDGSSQIDFMRYDRLAPRYRMADVACWPTQESMSMLDAIASGIPIIVSDRVGEIERVTGNGLTYHEPDPESLAESLKQLMDPAVRAEMGKHGREKMVREFSWELNAKSRIPEYERL